MKKNLLKTLVVSCVTAFMLVGCGNGATAENKS